jgi:glycosyltransferase involved in cell wall biosynthesis
MPSYNAEKYIIEAINSLLLQTAALSKIIIVDDGSTDNTLALIRQHYAKQLKSGEILLHLLANNAGVSNARNIGVSLADTQWILFLDADDTLHPEALSQLLSRAKELNVEPTQPYHLIHAAYQLIDHKSKLVSKPFIWRQVGFDETLGWAFYRNHISTSGLLVNRQKFVSLGGFEATLVHNEDLDLWLRFSHTSGIGYVDNTLIYVRRHADNASSRVQVMHKAERMILQRYSVDKIKSALLKRECSFGKNISDFVSILYRLDEWERGYKEAEKAKIVEKDNTSLHFFTGVYWLKMQSYEKALLDFQHCEKQNKPNGAVLNNLGAVSLCLGERANAREYFNQALSQYPNYIDALNNFALLSDENIDVKKVKFTWRELRPILTNYAS